jgi:hypothetical protein
MTQNSTKKCTKFNKMMTKQYHKIENTTHLKNNRYLCKILINSTTSDQNLIIYGLLDSSYQDTSN